MYDNQGGTVTFDHWERNGVPAGNDPSNVSIIVGDPANDDAPTTLTVPKMIAMNRMIFCRVSPTAAPITSSAPTRTMPWIALVPDISGVCSVLGTFEITA